MLFRILEIIIRRSKGRKGFSVGNESERSREGTTKS